MFEPQAALPAGQVAVVTGGGFNIGRAVALRLAALGLRVTVASRTAARLHVVVDEIERAGGSALAVPCDVVHPEQVERVVAETVRRFGRVDLMVAAAGGSGAHLPVGEVDPEIWRTVVANNLFGTFHCAHAVLPRFRAQGSGHLIHFAGGGAFFPMLGVHATAYASAKAAICRFTDQLQAELLDTAIRVNCVDPGEVWSPEQRVAIEAEERRTGQPHPGRHRAVPAELAADLIAFLHGPAGSAVRGRLVSVHDRWWHDPEEVAGVEQSVARYRLRRHDGP
ncbi:MAG: SDR family oxidoreductase [Planctomycetes bacterium]|nr:SDR family oxidoreductase [Planctomycetota bacterium]